MEKGAGRHTEGRGLGLHYSGEMVWCGVLSWDVVEERSSWDGEKGR